MRIGLNLLHALPEIGGGWTYISNLLASLAHVDQSNEYTVFANRLSRSLVPNAANFTVELSSIDARSRAQRIIYENTVLPLKARRLRLDCLHWFANTQAFWASVPGLVTIYDLQAFREPSPYPAHKRIYLRIMLTAAVKQACMLLPMSQATADDLHRTLNVEFERMVVIPHSLTSQSRPRLPEEVLRFRDHFRLPDKFWLYVAHFYAHKNHERILQAYHELKTEGSAPWPLVLRGDPNGAEASIHELIARLHLEPDIIFLPRLAEDELPLLYSAATALIFPSLYEGAGLPVIEAMACGCPVVASGIPPVREYAGEAASYFDASSVAAMKSAIVLLQSDERMRFELACRGLRRAADFSPARIGKLLLMAYHSAATGVSPVMRRETNIRSSSEQSD